MLKKQNTSSIFPPGCPGLFPRDKCTNPTITLKSIGTISCSATITGKVRCDLRPLEGVRVDLTSSFAGITFSNPVPITDKRGEFTTTAIVTRNTPVTPNVRITAEATVVDQRITDSVTARVECLNCPNPIITITPETQLLPLQLPRATCPGTPISGTLTCEGLPVPNAEVTFEVESESGKVIVTPNPTITDNNGKYSATILPFSGALEIVTIVAVATFGGNTARSAPQQYEVICPGCDELDITIDDQVQISCRGTISGRLTCDGVPVATVPVSLSASPVLNIINPNPVTDGNGEFSTLVTVNFDTPLQEAFITAEASYNDQTATVTGTVFADCTRCETPDLTLFTPEGPVGCDGGTITGQFTCNGEPIADAPVYFTVISAGSVSVDPNPAITDSNGLYTAVLQPGLDVNETISIYATSMIGGVEVTSPSSNVLVDCACTNPVIELDDPGPISCRSVITGRLLCEGFPVPNVAVTLSSPLLQFQTPNPITGPNGEFSSVVTVQPITPVQEGVPYTAEATVNGIMATNTNFVRAECLVCDGQSVTLIPPEGTVGCDGASISGRVLCGNTPAKNVAVFFTIDPSVPTQAFVNPNPAITDDNGNYTAFLTPVQGTVGTIQLSAYTSLAGNGISAGPYPVRINCPTPPPVCPCKFNLSTKEDCEDCNEVARIRVTQFGKVTDYSGELAISVTECGLRRQSPCDPKVDNFSFDFKARNGDRFRFTQGRRTSISCRDNFTVATVEGTINGRINNGPIRTYNATITARWNQATNIITWEIFATDNTTTTFQTITPFTAPGESGSFIAGCQ
ncbi:hypothetical protein [Rossellomorea vietnamensis]|uniref:hypothetical protein n=1 Tax=Rossellomorea vietnamensis TaxID=218284 RepID=UPI001E2E32C0|nr:hypothetical protein [Rossellomorea vietnamensis]MCC5801414.1 hypothetical protein [Rossellomorea vietnamensis]